MSSIVDAVAGGIARMDDAQLVELLRRVVLNLDVRFVQAAQPAHNQVTHAVVPRRLTEAMFYAVRHDHWTEANGRRVVQELWRKAIERAEREGS